MLDDSNRSEAKSKGRKPFKTWVDKGTEFYNNSFKKWLKNNDAEVYSIHNEGKSVVAERFIRTLKNKIYKYMTAISKNVYINKLKKMLSHLAGLAYLYVFIWKIFISPRWGPDKIK